MSILSNSVNLIGYLGKDVELTTFNSGSKRAATTVATTEVYKNQKGEMVKNTTWHNVVAWGNIAEQMEQNLAKGNKIAINGVLAYRNYEDKSGVKKTFTEINVTEFHKLVAPEKKTQESV